MSDDEERDQQTLTDREQERWKELNEVPPSDLTDKETTSKLKLSLKRRFSGAWVLVFEFGWNGRIADGLAVSLVASRNYKLVGFELKASRSDWLRELRDQEKAEDFVRICDEWYIVAPKGVVEDSEIPTGWGYLEMKPNSEQLYKMQDSDMTEYQQGSPDRDFWVRFLKKTVGNESNYTQADLREARSRGYDEAKEEQSEQLMLPDRERERIEEKAEAWDELSDRFAGIRWRSVSDEQLEAIERGLKVATAIDGGGHGTLTRRLEMLDEHLDREFERMNEAVAEAEGAVDELLEEIDEVDLPGVTDEQQ